MLRFKKYLPHLSEIYLRMYSGKIGKSKLRKKKMWNVGNIMTQYRRKGNRIMAKASPW